MEIALGIVRLKLFFPLGVKSEAMPHREQLKRIRAANLKFLSGTSRIQQTQCSLVAPPLPTFSVGA